MAGFEKPHYDPGKPDGILLQQSNTESEDCPECGGAGFFAGAEPGKLVACNCLIRAAKEDRRLAFWGSLNARYRSFTAEGWPHPNKTRRDILSKIIAGAKEASSWYFCGRPGVGKTGLALVYANAFLDEHTKVPLFVSGPKLFAELRDTYSHVEGQPTEMQVVNRYAEAGLLILDDLGSEHVSASGWAEDRLYQIIGERHGEIRPTLITSNMSLGQIGRKFGERIEWRIFELCGKDHIIELTGPNLRDAD